MPQIIGKLAVCTICDAVYNIADWDDDWDEFGCPTCLEQTQGE